MAKKRKATREDYRLIKRIQSAAYYSASEISDDHKLVSFAFMELALIIAAAHRSRHVTRLEHRDHVVEAVEQMHDTAWEDTAPLFEKIRKGVKEDH